jgi:hypothetical protein
LPSDSPQFGELQFLTVNGIDTAMSACQYYKAIRAVDDCSGADRLMGGKFYAMENTSRG